MWQSRPNKLRFEKEQQNSCIFLKGVSNCTMVAKCCCGLSKLPSITSPKDNMVKRSNRTTVLQNTIGLHSKMHYEGNLQALFREIRLGAVHLKERKRPGWRPFFWPSLLRCSCSCGNSKWSLPCGHVGIGWGSDL